MQQPKVGLPVGTLIYTGSRSDEKVSIDMFVYNTNEFEDFEDITAGDIDSLKKDNHLAWINISGVHDLKVIRSISRYFAIHSLVQEDIVNVKTRPNFEDFDRQIKVNCKMIYFTDEELDIENISVILGGNYVVTFQEKPGDVFRPIRQRIMKDGSKIRSEGSDFLFYALIDAVVDHYFVVLTKFGEKLDDIETELQDNDDQRILNDIHNAKMNIIKFRKAVYPIRDVMSELRKSENKLIKSKTFKYIHDIYDHVVQIIDTTESQKEHIASLTDLYMNSVSNKMNKVMQFLTIIATIFIPLTFIAGIYGMNFAFMPELQWKYSYFVVWGVMIVVTFAMIVYFKNKRWI